MKRFIMPSAVAAALVLFAGVTRFSKLRPESRRSSGLYSDQARRYRQSSCDCAWRMASRQASSMSVSN